MTRPRDVGIVSLLFLLVSIVDVQAAQSGEEGRKSTARRVRISQSAISNNSAPLWVAQGQGFFGKYGLEAEIIYVRSSTMQMAALSTGQVDVSITGGTPVLFAAAAGQSVKLVSSTSSRLTSDLVVRPEIAKPEDLRNKRFGVSIIGGTSWMEALLALEYLGLNPGRDSIQINATGGQSIRASALETGSIDAALLAPLLSRTLKTKGFRILLELSQVNVPFVNTGIVASTTYLDKHPDVVDAILKSLLEAQAFIASPTNKASVIKTLMHHMRISDRLIAEEGYQEMARELEKRPYPSVEGLRNIQRLLAVGNPKIAAIKVEDLVDSRFMRKLEDSGFIDRVYTSTGK
jgi:ABC-type nitrate/sulfonate/bicarbonate transport system substrate-binding protein